MIKIRYKNIVQRGRRMKKWYGSAAVCFNERNELLMVKQGTPEEVKKYAIPSGGKEESETFEQCCIREVKEETGYDVKIKRLLMVKHTMEQGIPIEAHYFEVEIIGGRAEVNDPDGLIYEVTWQPKEKIEELLLSFPEDRKYLIQLIEERGQKGSLFKGQIP